MSGSTENGGEEYGQAEINDRGRLTIPKALREDLNIEGGTTFTVVRQDNTILLVRQLPELETVSTGRDRDEWDEDAFRDAGRATFGGR